MLRTRTARWTTAAAAVAVAAFGVLGWQATRAQQNEATGEQQAQLTLPSGEEMLQLEVVAPDQVRLSEEMQYDVRVTNVTDDVMLYDVKIAQRSADQFQVESAKLSDRKGQKDQKGQRQRDRENQRAGNKKSGQNDRQAGRKGQQRDEKRNRADRNRAADAWTIDRLAPGESRTISVTAAFDQPGQREFCLMVEEFTPALCVQAEVVKPDVELVKQAPETASLCEEFEIEYFVKNTGSGTIKTLEVSDPLEQGLQLADGENEVRFSVDDLETDEVKKFVATVCASETGEFASRARAETGGGLTARSKNAGTRVEAADLQVGIDGPSQTYLNSDARYTIRVTNTGDAVAPDTTLAIAFPEWAGVTGAGEVQATNATADALGGGGGAGNRQRSGQGEERSDRQNAQPETESWEVGDLQPGESRQVTVSLDADEQGRLEVHAVAQYVCGACVDEDDERVQARAATSTEVLSVPALAIGVADETDPVPVGETLVYTIAVENEGTETDSDVQVTSQLPENFEFVEGSGTTQVSQQGGELQFGAVDELAPGDTAQWDVQVRAKQAGEVRFPITVNSEKTRREARAEEPTRLFEQ